MTTTRAGLAAGARAVAPVLAALVPAGVALGAAWTAAGLPAGAGALASATVYGASAQLVVLDLAARGAGLAVLVVATVVVSLRLGVLGAAVGRELRGARAPVRWVGALVLVDPASLVADAHPSGPARRRHVYLGAALVLWAGWQVAHGVGLLVGARVPEGLALEAALPLCLVGLLAPRLADREAAVAAVTAAVVAVAAAGAPFGTGLLAAIGAGLLIARGRSR